MTIFMLFIGILWSAQSWGESSSVAMINKIAGLVENPEIHLAKQGKLVVLGNASLKKANILLLPEVHDDPDSLLTQLLIIAREKRKPGRLIILSESVPALKQSPWELMSHKVLDLVAASQKAGSYSPRRFEQALQKLTLRLRQTPGVLDFDSESGLWTLSAFAEEPIASWGWDLKNSTSLSDRNAEMVRSIKGVLQDHDRVVLTLGARHVPELEYATSLRLLCPGHNITDMDQFFSRISDKYGDRPELPYGIGATAPIYRYLAHQKYAVVFSEKFYEQLEQAVSEKRKCWDINE